MCKWGTEIIIELQIPDYLSHTGEKYIKKVAIDSCIASIVKALNDNGIHTIACCCGHGKQPGRISLADGRELLIANDYYSAQTICKSFPPIN